MTYIQIEVKITDGKEESPNCLSYPIGAFNTYDIDEDPLIGNRQKFKEIGELVYKVEVEYRASLSRDKRIEKLKQLGESLGATYSYTELNKHHRIDKINKGVHLTLHLYPDRLYVELFAWGTVYTFDEGEYNSSFITFPLLNSITELAGEYLYLRDPSSKALTIEVNDRQLKILFKDAGRRYKLSIGSIDLTANPEFTPSEHHLVSNLSQLLWILKNPLLYEYYIAALQRTGGLLEICSDSLKIYNDHTRKCLIVYPDKVRVVRNNTAVDKSFDSPEAALKWLLIPSCPILDVIDKWVDKGLAYRQGDYVIITANDKRIEVEAKTIYNIGEDLVITGKETRGPWKITTYEQEENTDREIATFSSNRVAACASYLDAYLAWLLKDEIEARYESMGT